ncbi:hypothetical protein [Cereibacter johrii]|uniref:hypothetical protein n=1 Tax=Cereibacter johrii TaxID=445629 RepID=UPI003CE91F83
MPNARTTAGLRPGSRRSRHRVLPGGWQDFRFEDDATHGDNRLAVAPKTVVSATLGWEATPELRLTGVLKRVDDVPVANANTLWAESYLLADLRGEYRVNERLSLLWARTPRAPPARDTAPDRAGHRADAGAAGGGRSRADSLRWIGSVSARRSCSGRPPWR